MLCIQQIHHSSSNIFIKKNCLGIYFFNLRSVADEVHHQVFRLTSHPSVIIWSGNNENEGALRQNWYGTARNFSLYEDDYVKLYIDTIKAEVLRNAPNKIVNFITSSPTNGLSSDDQGYVAENPADPFFGDGTFSC